MIKINAIKAFNDNYIWCIANQASTECILVDPGDADVCIEYIRENKLSLQAILITHHHADHVGGLKKLLEFSQSNTENPIVVYGPKSENIKYLSVLLSEGDKIELFNGKLSLNVFDLPGHTKGHIAYFNDQYLFCGDTLFSGGCGRLFEGTPKQMHSSLQKLASLDNDTLVYCAHEYTKANLEFARTIEPNNGQLNKYWDSVVDLRNRNIATIPTSIGLEKQINPFLRCDEQEVKDTAQHKAGVSLQHSCEVFATIRTLKDNF